ncbi:hypothetical protein HELRODRAFT_173091 [Helobdella robusta]|uniref:Uncharacterized protein n=1 Tax=Helobdella robusta TaxID=6412 RepID=T1F6B9_HELRO|nr:hypothetical protein HELRODRAFT_173091 [Helobdella robusta]ESO04022.1 hypothetical protein HELRODRAFT_173091 [Helobdella robusta]
MSSKSSKKQKLIMRYKDHLMAIIYNQCLSKGDVNYSSSLSSSEGLVAEWLACPSTTPTTRVRILQFLQVYPGSQPSANPAVHLFEDVSCRMLAGEMAQWFKCSLSQNISMAIIYSAYMMRCLRVNINTCVRRV